MASFRFETFENTVNKHALKKINWTQAAQWAFLNHTAQAAWTIASVRQLSDDTVEIVKRRDVNKSLLYKVGLDQAGVYERVVVNRADQTVAVDRLDINWLNDAPFVGRRDLFMPSRRSEGGVDFIRHNFWIFKLLKPCETMCSTFAAWSYRSSFKRKEVINALGK